MAAKPPTDHCKCSHQLGYCSHPGKYASTGRVKSTHLWDYWTNSHPICRASSPETWNCPVTKLCLFANSWTAACQTSLSFTISQSLLKFMSIESMMLSNHLIFCHPFLLLPSIFPSIRVFSNELALCTRWLKYWSFSFSVSPSSEYSGLISLRIDWSDLLAIRRTLKSLFQHHN